MVINDPSSRISNSTTSSNSHGINPNTDSNTMKMMVVSETEVHAYHSQIEQMTRKLEKTSIDLAISQEQNKYLESQLDPRGDVSVTTTAIQQVPSKEQSSLQQDKTTNPYPPADWHRVIQEMDRGNGDLMICLPMFETHNEMMMKNVFTRLISMLHRLSSEEEETKPFCAVLVPNAAASKCLFTKHFQDQRINTIYTNDDGTPIWAWETHMYPTVGLFTCQCFFTEVGLGRLKLDNLRFFMMHGVDLLVNDPDFVNCLMQLKAISSTTINYRMLAFSSSMDTHLKRMMPKILRPGYKQMIFDNVQDVTNAHQPNRLKASDQQNVVSSLLDRIHFDEEPLASSADAPPHHRPAQVHDEQVEMPRNQQDLWSEEGEEEEDDNDIGLPRPGQQKKQLILKQEAESSQKKKMPKFSIWNHAAGANGQSGSEPSARSLQPSNSAAASEATGNGGDGGGGDTGKGNKNNGSAARFERPLRLTSQHSTGIFYPI